MTQETKSAFGESRLSLFERAGGWLSRRKLNQLFRGRRGLAVLDIGCGYKAILLRGLDAHLARGVGLDRRIDASLSTGKYEMLQGEVEQVLPGLQAQQFDAIMLINVVEHLWEPVPVLRECNRLLKPGGMLFVNVPSWFGKWFLETQAYALGGDTSGEVDDHKMYYGKRDLWPLLVKAGFRPSLTRLRYHKFGLNLYALSLKPA